MALPLRAIAVFHAVARSGSLTKAGRDIIAVANRETDEAALYIVTP
ncbi:MAG: hypothetical protein QMB52_07855 [Propionivibrio sp.]